MPDFDSHPPTLDSVFDAAADPGTFATEKPAVGLREGLPKSYGMRHDAHYVEQLSSRSAALPIRMIPVPEIDGLLAPPTDDLSDLTASVLRHGLLQPLLVRRKNGRYDLIAGVRRLAAARAARLAEVPCLVHQADDVRARALAEADNLCLPRTLRPDAAVSSDRAASLDRMRGELIQMFATLESSLNLLAGSARPLRERFAIDLMRVEAGRGEWLVRASQALSDDPIRVRKPVELSALMAAVIEALEPECRLAGATMVLERSGTDAEVRGDASLLMTAIAGACRAMQALAQHAGETTTILRVRDNGSSVIVEIVHDHLTLGGPTLARLFDPTWLDRPGGYPAMVAMMAARHITMLEGGQVEASAEPSGGCTLRFVFAKT